MVDARGRLVQRQETAITATSTAIPSVIPFGTTNTGFTGSVTFATGSASVSIASASSTHSESASATKASATASPSTSTSSTSSDNVSVLVPAVVAPIAALLIISFVAFWWFMRRRQKKELENEPEFVMEGMKEKPRSRPPTADSNSSTQELVPSKSKEATIKVQEVERPDTGNNAVNKETNFAPPRLESALDSRPGSRQTDQTGRSKVIPNFSRGPRSMSRDATPSPAPAFAQEERSGSRAGHNPSPLGGQVPRPGTNVKGPEQGNTTAPTTGRPHHPRAGSFSRPLGPPVGVSRGPPAPLNTRAERPSQDGHGFNPTTGAYNGSSPISQYSPIVKEMPRFAVGSAASRPYESSRGPNGSISSINDQGIRKPPPSAIKTSNSPVSPADATFSEENMRIARLANNSHGGFHSMVATTAATSPATEEPPTPSPRLPPPATRDAPPTTYNIPLPAHEPPAPASIQARLNGASISDRRSVISGLSDDYVDMEVDDNKSDVSSLDEREKWQMHTDAERANSRQAGLGGYGGLGPRAPLTSKDSRHGSEASDSQYSLSYYTKDGDKGKPR